MKDNYKILEFIRIKSKIMKEVLALLLMKLVD